MTAPPALPPSVARGVRRRALGAMLLDTLIALAASLLLMLAGFVVWIAWREIGNPAFDPRALPEPNAVVLIVLTALATGGPALLLWRWRRWPTPPEWHAAARALTRPATWLWSIGVAVLVALANAGIGTWLEHARIHVTPTNQALLLQADAEAPLLLGVFAVLIGPAYEELLFRRVLFGRLWQAGAPALGIVLSSALFACAHELPGVGGGSALGSSVLWLSYAGMGAAFAWVYRRTGSLPAAIVTHGLHNAIALWVLPH